MRDPGPYWPDTGQAQITCKASPVPLLASDEFETALRDMMLFVWKVGMRAGMIACRSRRLERSTEGIETVHTSVRQLLS